MISALGSSRSLIGVPSPLALALWLGVVSQFVPVIGTYIGGALPALIALLDEPTNALWVLGFLVIYQQLENYVLAPRITAATMAIHPAVAFGAAIAGAGAIGPVGALLALPAAAIIQAFVSSYIAELGRCGAARCGRGETPTSRRTGPDCVPIASVDRPSSVLGVRRSAELGRFTCAEGRWIGPVRCWAGGAAATSTTPRWRVPARPTR